VKSHAPDAMAYGMSEETTELIIIIISDYIAVIKENARRNTRYDDFSKSYLLK